MKLTRQFKSLFSKENINNRDFNEVLNEILDDTFKKKRNLHVDYYHIVQRILNSNRSTNCKTNITKYLLARLTRESERIFLKASFLANRLCPCCSKSVDPESNTVFSDQSNSIH